MYAFVVCKTLTQEVEFDSFSPVLYFLFASAMLTLKEKDNIANPKFTSLQRLQIQKQIKKRELNYAISETSCYPLYYSCDLYFYFSHQIWFKKLFIGVFSLKFKNFLINRVKKYLRLKSLEKLRITKFTDYYKKIFILCLNY